MRRSSSVGDLPLAELRAACSRRASATGGPPAVPRGTKNFAAAPPAPRPRIVLIDRPQSPQSMILAGQVLPVEGTEDLLDPDRGQRGARRQLPRRGSTWTCARHGLVLRRPRQRPTCVEHQVPYIIQRAGPGRPTGDSIAARSRHVARLPRPTSGVTAGRADADRSPAIPRQLPGQFETSPARARRAALERALPPARQLLGDDRRPLSRHDRADARHEPRARDINPDKFVWVVVGDAARVRPQLERLGLPIEVMQPR